MKTSSISRSERKLTHQQQKEVQHRLWVVRMQEIMAEKKWSGRAAYVQLKDEVDEQIKVIAPQIAQQFKECWAEFQQRAIKAGY